MSTDAPTRIPPGPVKLTMAEYVELPDDGNRYEILDGDLYMTPAPVPRHQKISRRLQFILYEAFEKRGLGEVYNAPIDVVLGDHDICQPDIALVLAEELDIIGEKNIQGAPTLLIEILSPSTRRKDVLLKSNIYARFGVKDYWIVDPDIDQIDFYRLAGDHYERLAEVRAPATAEPDGYPGVVTDLAEVFR